MKKLIKIVLFIGVILILGFTFHDEITEFLNKKLGKETTEEVTEKVKNGTKELFELIDTTVTKVVEQNEINGKK